MGIRDHFRRSSMQPPPFQQPVPEYQPPPPQPPINDPAPPQQHLAHPAAPIAPPTPQQPLFLHLTYDSSSGRTARLTTHPFPSSPTLYTITTHTRSPELRFTNAHNQPFADANTHIGSHLSLNLPSGPLSISAPGWNVWEYPYSSPALGGRQVSWRTPEGPYGDNMECVFVDGGLPVARWVGSGWAIGAREAGRLDMVAELSGAGRVVDECCHR